MQAAARIMLHDWNDGRISYYTLPPKRNDHGHAAAAVVPAYSTEFNADEVGLLLLQWSPGRHHCRSADWSVYEMLSENLCFVGVC